jgi:hypothetical protein
MPFVSNSNYRLGAKVLTTRSIGTNAIIVALLMAITIAGSKASVDEVVRWNQIATDAATAANTNPLTESCIFAILHVAIHDAVNAVESRYEPYLPRTSPAPAGASVQAAIAGAAHDTLVAAGLFFGLNLFQDLRCLIEHSQLKIPARSKDMPLPNRVSRNRRLLKEENERLCGCPGHQQKTAGRHSQHDERPEMMILRLPAQWAFFFHWLAGGSCDYRNC